ncbi:hypothetical protein SALBM311S_12961 [Streptomyces alboniger]
MASERIRSDAQPGVEHVSRVPSPPLLAAMTFVTAANLLEAEKVAPNARAERLDRTSFAGWQLTSCTADLPLGVWAAHKPPSSRTAVGSGPAVGPVRPRPPRPPCAPRFLNAGAGETLPSQTRDPARRRTP